MSSSIIGVKITSKEKLGFASFQKKVDGYLAIALDAESRDQLADVKDEPDRLLKHCRSPSRAKASRTTSVADTSLSKRVW